MQKISTFVYGIGQGLKNIFRNRISLFSDRSIFVSIHRYDGSLSVFIRGVLFGYSQFQEHDLESRAESRYHGVL